MGVSRLTIGRAGGRRHALVAGLTIALSLAICATALAVSTHRIGPNDDSTSGPCSASGGFWWRSNDPQMIGDRSFSNGFYAYGGRTVQGTNRYCLDLVLSGRYKQFKGTLGMIGGGPPDVRQRMQLIADGRVVYDRTGGLGQSFKFDISTRGVQRVVFRTYCVGRCNHYNITEARGGITGRLIAP